MLINDTSNVPITYSLSPSVTDVDEGGNIPVDTPTIGGITGTQIGYTISGVSSVDINNASLTGTYTIGTDTLKVLQTKILLLKVLRLQNGIRQYNSTVFAEVTINDTSTTVVSGSEVITHPWYRNIYSSGGVSNISIMAVGGGAGPRHKQCFGCRTIIGGGGSGAVAWLNNIPVTAGQVINYTVGAGGAGNNDGGDTTVPVQGVTYTAGGGSASPTAITGLSPPTRSQVVLEAQHLEVGQVAQQVVLAARVIDLNRTTLHRWRSRWFPNPRNRSSSDPKRN